jgi:hypothetical protein
MTDRETVEVDLTSVKPRQPWQRPWVLAIGAVILVGLIMSLTGCEATSTTETSSDTPTTVDAQCVAASAEDVALINSWLTVTGGGEIYDAYTYPLPDAYESVDRVVAAKISGEGMGDSVAVWATSDAGMIWWSNEYARAFTRFGPEANRGSDQYTLYSGVGKTDAADIAKDCVA